MTNTQKQSHANNTITALEEIREMGYIKPSKASQYYQKINYIITNFLQESPANPQDAVRCIQQLTEIGGNTDSFPFLSTFQNTIFNLYERATMGNELTKNQATTKLLSFFSYVSPNSIEQKDKLLRIIQALPDLDQRGNEISKVVMQIADHYDRNQQFNDDPDLSVLKNMSDILHQISLPGRGKIRSNKDVFLAKERLQNCANLVRAHAPKLYDHSWEEKFHPQHRTYIPSCSVKEPAVVFSVRGQHMQKNSFIDY